MSRYFTLAEAERLLPEVTRTMETVLQHYAAHQEADTKFQDGVRRIVMLGGSIADQDSFTELKEQKETAATALNAALENIHALGCQVKDLSLGLVDFPTLYREAEVLLCWRYGEDHIEFWHGLEEGFRGRKPIDQDFLDNHHGDQVH